MAEILDLEKLKHTEPMLVDAFSFLLVYAIKQAGIAMGVASLKWQPGSHTILYTMACEGLLDTFRVDLSQPADTKVTPGTVNVRHMTRQAAKLATFMAESFAHLAQKPGSQFIGWRFALLPFVVMEQEAAPPPMDNVV